MSVSSVAMNAKSKCKTKNAGRIEDIRRRFDEGTSY
jgi:hypothetical protein